MEALIPYLWAFGIVGLIYVFVKNAWVSKQEVGDEKMARIAKTRGLTSMQAVVMANNTPMLNVFEKGGFKRQPADEPGEVLLKLSLVDEKEASCQ